MARRLTAGREGPVLELEALTGDAYEAWVAGLDPDSAEPRGRLRADAAGVRFVEVVVNGPQVLVSSRTSRRRRRRVRGRAFRAAEQIIGWPAQHATTRDRSPQRGSSHPPGRRSAST